MKRILLAVLTVLCLALFAVSPANAQAKPHLAHSAKISSTDYKTLSKKFTPQEIKMLDQISSEQDVDQMVKILNGKDPFDRPTLRTASPLTFAAAVETNGCTMSPDSWGKANFKPTCDAHDICYSVGSTTNRLDCDNVFLASLLRECERAYSAGLMRSTCRGVAQTYYTAVRTFGASYYDGAGSKA